MILELWMSFYCYPFASVFIYLLFPCLFCLPYELVVLSACVLVSM